MVKFILKIADNLLILFCNSASKVELSRDVLSALVAVLTSSDVVSAMPFSLSATLSGFMLLLLSKITAILTPFNFF